MLSMHRFSDYFVISLIRISAQKERQTFEVRKMRYALELDPRLNQKHKSLGCIGMKRNRMKVDLIWKHLKTIIEFVWMEALRQTSDAKHKPFHLNDWLRWPLNTETSIVYQHPESSSIVHISYKSWKFHKNRSCYLRNAKN